MTDNSVNSIQNKGIPISDNKHDKPAKGTVGINKAGQSRFKGASDNISTDSDIKKDVFAKSYSGGDISQEHAEVIKGLIRSQQELVSQFNYVKEHQGWLGRAMDWTKNNLGGDSKSGNVISKLWSHIFDKNSGSKRVAEEIARQGENIKELYYVNPKEFDKKYEEITGKKLDEKEIEKLKNNGNLLADSSSSKIIENYKQSQTKSVDFIADMATGIATFGVYTVAIAAAPATLGSSLAITTAGLAAATVAGTLIKSGIKAGDAISGKREYSAKDFKNDAITGGLNGLLAPVTAGIGGAAGKTVATRLGLQIVKEGAEEAVANTAVKAGTKGLLEFGNKYAGNNILKKGAAYAAEAAAAGAAFGTPDGYVRNGLDTGNWTGKEAAKSAVEGGISGLLAGPLLDGGFRITGKIGSKIANILFRKSPKELAISSQTSSLLPENKGDIAGTEEHINLHKNGPPIKEDIKPDKISPETTQNPSKESGQEFNDKSQPEKITRDASELPYIENEIREINNTREAALILGEEANLYRTGFLKTLREAKQISGERRLTDDEIDIMAPFIVGEKINLARALLDARTGDKFWFDGREMSDTLRLNIDSSKIMMVLKALEGSERIPKYNDIKSLSEAANDINIKYLRDLHEAKTRSGNSRFSITGQKEILKNTHEYNEQYVKRFLQNENLYEIDFGRLIKLTRSSNEDLVFNLLDSRHDFSAQEISDLCKLTEEVHDIKDLIISLNSPEMGKNKSEIIDLAKDANNRSKECKEYVPFLKKLYCEDIKVPREEGEAGLSYLMRQWKINDQGLAALSKFLDGEEIPVTGDKSIDRLKFLPDVVKHPSVKDRNGHINEYSVSDLLGSVSEESIGSIDEVYNSRWGSDPGRILSRINKDTESGAKRLLKDSRVNKDDIPGLIDAINHCKSEDFVFDMMNLNIYSPGAINSFAFLSKGIPERMDMILSMAKQKRYKYDYIYGFADLAYKNPDCKKLAPYIKKIHCDEKNIDRQANELCLRYLKDAELINDQSISMLDKVIHGEKDIPKTGIKKIDGLLYLPQLFEAGKARPRNWGSNYDDFYNTIGALDDISVKYVKDVYTAESEYHDMPKFICYRDVLDAINESNEQYAERLIKSKKVGREGTPEVLKVINSSNEKFGFDLIENNRLDFYGSEIARLMKSKGIVPEVEDLVKFFSENKFLIKKNEVVSLAELAAEYPDCRNLVSCIKKLYSRGDIKIPADEAKDYFDYLHNQKAFDDRSVSALMKVFDGETDIPKTGNAAADKLISFVKFREKYKNDDDLSHMVSRFETEYGNKDGKRGRLGAYIDIAYHTNEKTIGKLREFINAEKAYTREDIYRYRYNGEDVAYLMKMVDSFTSDPVYRDNPEKINEFYTELKTLLDTNYGGYVFKGRDNMNALKRLMSIRESEQANQETLSLIKMVNSGQISPYVFYQLSEKGRLNPNFISDVRKVMYGEPIIYKTNSIKIGDALSEIKSKTKTGDVASIGYSLYVNTGDGIKKLKMSPETYLKLFPPITRFASEQGPVGDCFYLIVATGNMMDDPKLRIKLYEMFEEKNNDIIVNIPGRKPVAFKDGKIPPSAEGKLSRGSLGQQMLELAYGIRKMEGNGVNVIDNPIENLNMNNVINFLNQGGYSLHVLNDLMGTPSRSYTFNGGNPNLGLSLEDTTGSDIPQILKLDGKNHMEVLKDLLNHPDCTFNASTRNNDYQNLWDEKNKIFKRHAHYLKSFNTDNQTVEYMDPHNSANFKIIPLELFNKFFYRIHIGLKPLIKPDLYF